MTVKENVKLAKYTTYNIGGPARYFVNVKNYKDLREALEFVKKQNIQYMVLGGGSNVVISDKGYNGLVIHMANKEIDFQGQYVYVSAGVEWDALVDAAILHGFAGIEWGAGIPGQVGGAIRGNAGAFYGEIKDAVEHVEAVIPGKTHQIFSNEDCNFSYRSSYFKEKGGIILSAKLKLVPGDKKELLEKTKEFRTWRNTKHPIEYGSCGSVFKRVDINAIKLNLWERYPDMKDASRNGQVATAYFIDQCDLKNFRIGGAEVSDKHPNFIVNRTGKATFEDVFMLTGIVRSRVCRKFGVILEEEPDFLI